MSDNILSDDQYNKLMEGSLYFEEYNNIGAVRTIDPRFLTKLREVYSEFYHSHLNVNCGQCIGSALTKLWHHMQIKKGILEQESQSIPEMDIVVDDNTIVQPKRPGRPKK